MPNKKICLPILLFLINFPLLAQFSSTPQAVFWEAQYGGNRLEQINSLIEGFDGGLIAVGTTQSNTRGKSDAYLLMLDKDKNLQYEKTFGGTGEDVACAVAKALDGTYWIAGYTESPLPSYKGNRDAWVLKIDEQGELIRQQCFGTLAKDELRDIIATEDGGALLVGHRQEHFWVLKLAANGGKEWEKTYPYQIQNSFAHACIIDQDKNIVVAGYTESKTGSNMLLLKIDEQGQIIWRKVFPRTEAAVAHDLVLTHDGYYAITGTANLPLKKEDAFFMSVNTEGKVLISTLFGGRGFDGAYAMTQATNGHLFLTGYTMSMIRKAREPRLWLQAITAYGEPLWNHYYGSKLADKGYDIIQHSDGQLLLGGIYETDKAWLLAFKPDTFPPTQQSTQLDIQNLSFSYPDNMGVLEPKQRGYASFVVTNLGTNDAYSIEATVACSTCLKGVDFFEKIPLGHLKAQQSKLYSIPVFTQKQVGNGKNQFDVTISAANQSLVRPATFVFDVRTKQAAQAQLGFSNPSFFAPKEASKKGDKISFRVEVKNTGDKTAQNITFQFKHHSALAKMNQQDYQLDYLKPGGLKYLQYDMVLQKELKDLGTLRVEAIGIGFPSAYRDFNIHLSQAYQQSEAPSIQSLTWLQPDISLYSTEPIVWEDKKFPIEIEVNSKIILEKENFKLWVNGDSCEGCKFDEASLLGDTTYIYKNNVTLQEGQNEIYLEIQHYGKKKTSPLIRVQYKSNRLNLYVLSIGVPRPDLAYSVKDAKDFAAAFEQQTSIKNGIFEEIRIDTLTSADQTTKEAILTALKRLRHHPIQPQDVVVVFISSHGTDKGNTVRFHCSDYKTTKLFETTLEYEQDFLANLERVGGKKLLFLDACHSGHLVAKKDFITMASCGADELSYEDETWQNGVFTEALLRVFRSTETSSFPAADANQNQIISVEEIYEYVKKVVPDLLKSVQKGPQNPKMPASEVDDFPLIKIE